MWQTFVVPVCAGSDADSSLHVEFFFLKAQITFQSGIMSFLATIVFVLCVKPTKEAGEVNKYIFFFTGDLIQKLPLRLKKTL